MSESSRLGDVTSMSAEERDALRARVTLHAPGLILFREQPVVAIAALEVMFERVEELSAGAPYRLIIDVSSSKRPGPAESEWILRWYKRNLGTSLEAFGLVTGNNRLINTALTFLARSAGFPGVQTFPSLEDAERTLLP